MLEESSREWKKDGGAVKGSEPGAWGADVRGTPFFFVCLSGGEDFLFVRNLKKNLQKYIMFS